MLVTKPTFGEVNGSGGASGVTLKSPAAFAPAQVQSGASVSGDTPISGTPEMPCGVACGNFGGGLPLTQPTDDAGGLGNKWGGE